MSYLARLMAQTGIEFASTALANDADATSLPAEIEEVGERPAECAAPEEESPVHALPRTGSPVEPVEVKETAAAPSSPPAREAAPDNREPEAQSRFLLHSEPRELPRVEVLIEERLVERVREAVPAKPAATRVDELAKPPVTYEKRKTEPTPAKAAVHAPRAPRPPTLVEVRNWVAATPAPEETPLDSGTSVATPFVPREASAGRRPETRPTRAAIPEDLAASPQVQHMELSIGTVDVTVEVPPPPAPLAPPSRPVVQPPSAPDWSRLARRYVRL